MPFLIKDKKLLEKYNKTSQCICISVILIDSVYKKDKSYYSRVFLEEPKYVLKEKKCLNLLLTT